MAKSDSGAAPPQKSAYREPAGNGQHNRGASEKADAASPEEAEFNELLDRAKGWVEENQTAAMLGGFGFGVFIGVLLRR